MADDVELFIFAPAQLASQKSEFFEEMYFRRHTCNGGFNGRVIGPVFLEFTVSSLLRLIYSHSARAERYCLTILLLVVCFLLFADGAIPKCRENCRDSRGVF